MQDFINDNFILQSECARRLYHEHARDLPIIDYHCHIPPDEIARDKRWDNISQVWLAGDHYKWRAMRSNGVPEEYCTGSASDWEKFEKWAATMPYLLRNPLYHWTQLELKRYFGVSELLGPDTAQDIWDICNEKLRSEDFTARGLIRQSRVVAICTTDDPLDTLEHHRAIAEDNSFETKVLPTWRPDKGLLAENPQKLNLWISQLESTVGRKISTYDEYLQALAERHDYFHAQGCRLADHGIETFIAEDYSQAEIKQIFDELRLNKALSPVSVRKFKSALLHELAIMNAEKGWVQQYHYGCIRNNNTRLFNQLGPDIGCDSIADFDCAAAMSRHFDRLDSIGKLAKTIIYNLNPRDNELVATMLGNFQDGSVPGKMQMGSGWWFLDQKDGMERQIEALSQLGLLSRFVGMLTDSRSFLSYTRHEYFRRILCNVLGRDMEQGLIPLDYELVGRMVRDISFDNANGYFGL